MVLEGWVEEVDEGELIQVMKLRLWDQMVPVAFSVFSDPLIPWKLVGQMFNFDHESELDRLLAGESFLSEKIEFMRWEDPQIVSLLGNATAPWIGVSTVPAFLTGLEIQHAKTNKPIKRFNSF